MQLAVLVLLSMVSTVTTQAGVISVESGKQLFLGPWAKDGRDVHLVESMKNVTMTMNEAHVTGERLVVLDKPWEGTRLLDVYVCVLKDGDVFRMYYGALPKYPKIWSEPNCRILCYAESKDGIHWKKPNLGLFEWNGSRENNIILPNDNFKYVMSEFAGPGVFIDPQAKRPEEKYKMIIKITPVYPKSGKSMPTSPKLPKGQYMFCSPDGIRWKLRSTQRVNPGASDSKFSVFWDDCIEKYVTYTRMKHLSVDNPRVRTLRDYYQKQYGLKIHAKGRLVGRITSDDLRHWSKEIAVVDTDAMDHLVISGYTSKDIEDGKGLKKYSGGVDVYSSDISMYSEAPNAYVGLPTFFYHWKKITTDIGGHQVPGVTFPGTLDVQLVTSRDGINFNRAPGRRPFIRLGLRGSWWSRMIWPSGNVVRVGDELWIYFSGHDVAHNKEQDILKSNGAIGRAILRLDGFISADAAYTGGELVTKPMVFAGGKLQLNIDTSAGGSVRAEIQDASGKPIKGFTASDADEINGNYIRVPVSWKDNTDVSSLVGKAIRLRFVMRDSKLYSFQFIP